MEWLKVEVYTNQLMEEIVTAIFLDAGALGVNVEGTMEMELQLGEYLDESIDAGPYHVSAYFPCDGSEENVLLQIKNKLQDMEGLELEDETASFDVKTQVVHEEDWANAWKVHFKPTQISENVVIKPSWEVYEPQKDDVVIELDPGMAFGTGTHESTKMCVQLLEEFLEPGATVIDVGTGSGILSIVAAKLGAGRVYATDNDSVAVEVANENIRLNNCEENICAVQSDLLDGLDENVKADIMLANIIADVIIEFVPTASRHLKKNGFFICSGVIDARQEDVEQALVEQKMKLIKIQSEGEWRAFVCKYRG